MRPLITAATLGWIYLLHFARPLGNLSNPRAQAQHYVGFATDLEERVAQQISGIGARITRAAVAQEIEISLVAAWQAPLSFEKHLKRIKNAPRYCPICCRSAGRRVRQVTIELEQLTLGLDLDDFPPPPRLPMDRYEFLALRRWHDAAAAAPALAVRNLDDEI